MRANHFLLIILIGGLFACNKSDIEYYNSFQQSEKAFSAFKRSSNNSYLFEVTSGSWTGFSWKTSITVANGIAIERKFSYAAFSNVVKPQAGWNDESMRNILTIMNLTPEEFKANNGKELGEVLQWTEAGSTVGTHINTPACQYLTLDAIYDEAKNNWLKKKDNVNTYFETNNNGMISNCGYVETGCADDCFRGINISLIQSL